MALLRKRKIDTISEKRVVTGMIVSTGYMHKVYPLIADNLAYFQTNYTETVAKWAIKFYEVYEEVPFKHIQDEFNMNKSRLREEDVVMIHDLLIDISKQYEAQESFNVNYLVDQTERWCKIRELEITSGNIKVLLDSGDLHGAESEISRFRKVQIQQSSVIDGETLFGEEDIYRTFEEKEDGLFSLPGALGRFLGPFERSWLVGLSGAFKRGKTWIAQEFAIMGMLSYLKVAFFSLEMNDMNMKQRIRKRLVAAADEEGKYRIPIFDCVHNQTGDCSLDQRVNDIPLLTEMGTNDEGESQWRAPEFTDDYPYRVCTECRKTNRDHYEAATWFEVMEIPLFEPKLVSRKLAAFDKMYSHLIKLKTYPRFTANVADITNDLNIMEQDGFIPDMIIIDYADILKAEDDVVSGVEKEDRTWIALAQLADIRNALVIAPTQVTKAALEANLLREQHTARWIGKLAHVDVMLAVTQTEEEKRWGRSRMSTMLHRHKEYDSGQAVTLLQQMNIGQIHLDSDFLRQEVRT